MQLVHYIIKLWEDEYASILPIAAIVGSRAFLMENE